MKNLLKVNAFKFFEEVYKKKTVPLVFLEIQQGSQSHQIKIRLNEHLVPETSENFLNLIKGFDSQNKKVNLKGKKFVNNLQGLLIETEDIPQTIYGEGMLNENYKQKFNQPGLVAMSRTDKEEEEKSSSGFFITFKPLDFLDKYVVVGSVVEGLSQLEHMASQGKELKIINSGQVGAIDL